MAATTTPSFSHWKQLRQMLAILLCIAAHDPKSIIGELIEKHVYKLKGTGQLEFHLGCNVFHDPDRTLCFGLIKYISRKFLVFMKIYFVKRQNLVHLE